MQEIIVWHNPRCSKSRDAVKYLEEQNVPHGTFLYMKEEFTSNDIKKVMKQLGINDINEMLRPTEGLYKSLDIKNKSQDEIIDLLSTNTKLIQRPIIIKDDKAVISRPFEKLIDLLK